MSKQIKIIKTQYKGNEMNRKLLLFIGMFVIGTGTASAMDSAKTYKNTTDIPKNITTPDKVETSIGTLNFFDGVPTKETAELTQDFLLKARGVDAFLKGIPGASLQELRKGPASLGADAVGKVAIFDHLMNSKSLYLTGNTSTLYVFPYINTKDVGPIVIEVPPMMLGAFDDAWFRYVGDAGLTGPDKGKGGKYLVLPPAYKGEIPSGYFLIKPKTYNMWLFMRGNISKGIDVAVKNVKDHLKVYPLSEADNPKPVEYISLSDRDYNTIHPNNFEFYEHLNHLIQEESDEMLDAETKGLFASIGIKKGKKFNPTEREKRILTDAVAIGNAAARANNWYPKADLADLVYFYKDVPTEWVMAYPAKNVFYKYDGAFNTDARAWFHYTYTAVTPAMATPHVGKGSDYCMAFKDSKHNVLDGSKTYKIHIPANVPMNDFWALTAYDTQTRSQLQTDQPFPTVGSQDKGIKTNSDGSIDIYFAPEAPKGYENNWLQTIPGKSWFVAFRMYGPLKPFLDKSWRISEIELVK